MIGLCPAGEPKQGEEEHGKRFDDKRTIGTLNIALSNIDPDVWYLDYIKGCKGEPLIYRTYLYF